MQWNELKSHLGHISSKDLPKVQKAFELGKEKHNTQKRKSGEPYFMHPIAVTKILANMGADTDTLVAALLHDTVEDTDLTLKEIDKAFNGDVASLINGVTKLEPKDVEDKPTLDDQIETLRKVFRVMEEDIRVMIIKLVDRLHNMQTIEHLAVERQKTMSQETLDIYVKIADRLSMQNFRDELEGLCLSLLNPPEFKKMVVIQENNESKASQAIADIIERIAKETPKVSQFIQIQYERKSWPKLRAQLNDGVTAVTGVSELTAVFICDSIQQCYETLGALHQGWQREALSFQDFINAPMISGYQGVHTTIILEDGTRVRCKIRTHDMQEYARRGITAYCFDEKAVGALQYVPWTKRIGALAENTAERSRDFWESLQSDILGDSIVIHGANDEQILLPKNSTALDGIFYLYGKKGMRVKDIFIDGKLSEPQEILSNATTLAANFSKSSNVQLDWLHYVHTNIATGHIRDALAKVPHLQKEKLGKKLLQETLQTHKHGFLEELNEKSFRSRLQEIGYSSLNDIYIAIADGRIDPIEVHSTLFQKANMEEQKRKNYITCYTVDPTNSSLTKRINELHKEFKKSFQSIRYKYKNNGKLAVVKIRSKLTTEESDILKRDLTTVGARNVSSSPQTNTSYILTIIVICLWGLNPVFAKWFLMHDVPPITLATLRFLAFGVFTSIFYGAWRYTQRKKYTPVRGIYKLAFLPALSAFALAIFTYKALLSMAPSAHLTVLRLNVLLIPIFYFARKHRVLRFPLIGLCALAAFIAMFQYPLDQLSTGVIFSLLALLAYASFSVITESVLQQHKIDMRFPSFLFVIGLFLGVAGIILAITHPVVIIMNAYTPMILFYVLLCVWAPYTLYSAVLKKAAFSHITDLFLLEVPLAIVLEVVILGTMLNPTFHGILIGIALVLLLIGQLLPAKVQVS